MAANYFMASQASQLWSIGVSSTWIFKFDKFAQFFTRIFWFWYLRFMNNKHCRGLCLNKTSLPSWFWSVRPPSLEICFEIPFEISPLILTSDFSQILTLTREVIFFFIDMIKFAVRWKMISHWYSLSFILPVERNMEQLCTGSWWMTNWGLSNIRKFEAAGVKICSLPTPETRNIQYTIYNQQQTRQIYHVHCTILKEIHSLYFMYCKCAAGLKIFSLPTPPLFCRLETAMPWIFDQQFSVHY